MNELSMKIPERMAETAQELRRWQAKLQEPYKSPTSNYARYVCPECEFRGKNWWAAYSIKDNCYRLECRRCRLTAQVSVPFTKSLFEFYFPKPPKPKPEVVARSSGLVNRVLAWLRGKRLEEKE
jgi:hypothetical protein